jgi:hypothetical protein
VHAETIAYRIPEAALAAVTDIDTQAAQALAAKCGILKWLGGSSEELLATRPSTPC